MYLIDTTKYTRDYNLAYEVEVEMLFHYLILWDLKYNILTIKSDAIKLRMSINIFISLTLS